MIDFENLTTTKQKEIADKAISALKCYESSEHNVSAGYDILRYAKAGVYTSLLSEYDKLLKFRKDAFMVDGNIDLAIDFLHREFYNV